MKRSHSFAAILCSIHVVLVLALVRDASLASLASLALVPTPHLESSLQLRSHVWTFALKVISPLGRELHLTHIY